MRKANNSRGENKMRLKIDDMKKVEAAVTLEHQNQNQWRLRPFLQVYCISEDSEAATMRAREGARAAEASVTATKPSSPQSRHVTDNGLDM